MRNARYACAIQPEVRYFLTSNRIFPGSFVPDCWSKERRCWVRGRGVDMGKGLVGLGTELTGVADSNRGIGGGGSQRELTGVSGSNRGT